MIAAIKRGDEDAFVDLVRTHNDALLRVARTYVASMSIAEEVVQDTWLAVIDGIDRFEGRSSLKTWLFTILINRSKARGSKESRSSAANMLGEGAGPSVPSDRFQSTDKIFANHWTPANYPVPLSLPEDNVVMEETMKVVVAAVRKLPTAQRRVIVLRDIEHHSASEACALLQITEANQRVLLHRARSQVRAALEAYGADPEGRLTQ